MSDQVVEARPSDPSNWRLLEKIQKLGKKDPGSTKSKDKDGDKKPYS